MRPTRRSIYAFRFLALVSLVSAATALSATAPVAHRRLPQVAQDLIQQAKQPNNDPALATMQLEAASWLQLHNPATIQVLASHYLSLGQLDNAIQTLNRLPTGEGSQQIADIRFRQQRFAAVRAELKTFGSLSETASGQALVAKSWLEENNLEPAITAAKAAYSYSQDQPYMELYALALQIGNRGGEYQELVDRQTATEALQALQAIKLSKVVRARLAYSQGLLMSSERLLGDELGLTNEAAILLAEIRLSTPGSPKAKLTDAKQQLETAINREPANPRLYELLAAISQRLGDTAAANTASQRYQQLKFAY